MMGTSIPSFLRITLSVSSPSIPGIFQSKIREKKSSSASWASTTRRMASLPESTQLLRIPRSSRISAALSQITWSSSTTSTGRPESSALLSSASSHSLKDTATINWLPSPRTLLTSIVPFIMLTIFWVIAMPRPVPCIWLVFDSSVREKGSKI